MAQPVLGGRYRIQRHLARGGMAEVYLARDELLDRPVAVKVLFPELARDASFVERFRREAQAAARLNHPNIVSVYDFGSDGEASYIVMEYITGLTLSELIRDEAPMDPRRAIPIAAAVAAGLDAAHREGIVHRDVKPANVLVADGVVKVADFGIARASYARTDLTMPGMVVGTSTYLSPEQARGGAVDQRSDLYSLALVLYE
ncbi:MAG: protein kinase domain-containing protein, partial [Acidimicrobiales bacterium]